VPVIAPGSGARVLTADDIMAGTLPEGPVLVYDEDGYYLGGVIAEKLRAAGLPVTLCTPSEVVSPWAGKTSERWTVRSHLMRLGVGLELAQSLTRFDGAEAVLTCTFTGQEKPLPMASVVMVTQRQPNDTLYHGLLARGEGDADALPFSLTRIGDCEAPAIVAAAVYAGHRYARELQEDVDIDQPLRHDRVDVGATLPPSAKYLETLQLYYEEEIEGEAYFAALAERLTDPEQRAKMQMMADVETYAAAAVHPLLVNTP